MKIGLFAIGIGKGARPESIRQVAQHGERLGFSTLWAPEHVVLFDQHVSKYPYAESGAFAAPSTSDFLDPYIALTYAAAVTSRIRLATGICLVPEHNPVVLAKVIASLDHLSGGRFALGVGIGWLAEEFEALGVPFERRAQRTREYIAAMRQLWGEEKTSFEGEFVRLNGVRSFPKPAQGAKVPIIFGGESVPALRRAAEYGTGWYGFRLGPDEIASRIERLKKLVAEAGRDMREIEIIVSPYDRPCTPADLVKYRDAGVSEVVVLASPEKDQSLIGKQIETLARQWIDAAARL